MLTNPELLQETLSSNAENLVRGMHMFAEDIKNGKGDLKLRPLLQAAALAGSIDCIVYLHGMGAAWSTEVTAAAAQGGHLDCLRHLHEQGCPWDAETTRMAAIHGHLPCLQYAHEHGCSMAFDIAEAACFDRVACVEYGIRNGCAWNEEVHQDILSFGARACIGLAGKLRALFQAEPV